VRPGECFQLDGRPVWYAMRWDPQVEDGRGAWRRRSTRTRNERAARAIAARWREEGELMRAGVTTAPLLQQSRPLSEHVREYVDFRRNHPRKPGARHIAALAQRLETVIAETGWTSILEITAPGLLDAIATLGARPSAGWKRRTSDGSMSAATRNHYRTSWAGFARWLHRHGRLQSDPLARLERWATRGHETFARRALTPEEAGRLITAAAGSSETIGGLTGVERAMLYRLALATGLRRNELASLTAGDLSLGGSSPHVVLDAKWTKNRKPGRQPLPAPVVPELARWVAGRAPKDRLWKSVPDSMAGVMRCDLKAAGVPVVDASGAEADFHGLRHTFGTWLARGGASPQECQRLMRHGSIELTQRLYTHLDDADLQRAVGGALNDQVCAFFARPAPATAAHSMPTDTNRVDGAEETYEMQETAPEAVACPSPTTAGHSMPPEENAPSRTRTLNPLIKRQRGADSQSAEGANVAQCAPEGCARFLRDDESDGSDDHDLPPSGSRRARHARDRADAGEQPDVDTAIERIRDVAAFAALGGGA
jgi:integrase